MVGAALRATYNISVVRYISFLKFHEFVAVVKYVVAITYF
jgi:hypothetical protein